MREGVPEVNALVLVIRAIRIFSGHFMIHILQFIMALPTRGLNEFVHGHLGNRSFRELSGSHNLPMVQSKVLRLKGTFGSSIVVTSDDT